MLFENYFEWMRFLSPILMKKKKQFSSRIERLNKRLIDLMLIESTDPDIKRLTRRLKKNWDELLVFLDWPKVLPTNNQAEQEIRPAMVVRKVIQGNQNERGARTQSILMTIYRTLNAGGIIQ